MHTIHDTALMRSVLDPQQAASIVLSKLRESQFGWVFNDPVDPVHLKLPDYFEASRVFCFNTKILYIEFSNQILSVACRVLLPRMKWILPDWSSMPHPHRHFSCLRVLKYPLLGLARYPVLPPSLELTEHFIVGFQICTLSYLYPLFSWLFLLSEDYLPPHGFGYDQQETWKGRLRRLHEPHRLL